MASGWAHDDAVQQQIDATIDDAVARVRNKLASGLGLCECMECGASISEARRQAVPGVKLCIDCQRQLDARADTFAGYNRRGSKDSHLR